MSRLARIVFPFVLALILWMSSSCVEAQTSSQDADQRGEQKTPVWTDPATGLNWAKRDNGSDVDWNTARIYCASLSLGGYTGWRLPEINELARIFDPNASVGVHHVMGGITLTGWPWSATRDRAGEAWYFHFVFGYRDSTIVHVGNSLNKRALCVRRAAGQEQRRPEEQEQRPADEQRRVDELHRAQDELNQRRAAEQHRAQEQLLAATQRPAEEKMPVWTDPVTGLMWAMRDNGSAVDRNAARIYCAGLTLGGYSGWRLPEIDELRQIYDTNSTRTFSLAGVLFQYHIKGGIELTGWHWSTTPVSVTEKEKRAAAMKQLGVTDLRKDPDEAWTFDFQVGQRLPIDVGVSYNKRALCVRRAGE